mmetsp:Transcript_5703/g.9051  ORF Transcript_5703/g.9051 Transcript_5703/m.9051 type:complete len:124 (+) Transcript_5703:1104-1475(+)
MEKVQEEIKKKIVSMRKKSMFENIRRMSERSDIKAGQPDKSHPVVPGKKLPPKLLKGSSGESEFEKSVKNLVLKQEKKGGDLKEKLESSKQLMKIFKDKFKTKKLGTFKSSQNIDLNNRKYHF